MAAIPVAIGFTREAIAGFDFALDFCFFGGFRSILFGRSVQLLARGIDFSQYFLIALVAMIHIMPLCQSLAAVCNDFCIWTVDVDFDFRPNKD